MGLLRSKFHRRPIIAVTTLLLTIAVVVSAVYYLVNAQRHTQSPPTARHAPASTGQLPSTPRSPSDTSKQPASNQSSPTTSPSATQPTASSEKAVVAVSMAISKGATALHIDSTIQPAKTAGICTVVLTGPPAHPVTQTSDVQATATGGHCTGFDLPLTQLTPGDWQVLLTYEGDTAKGSTSQTYTIPY